MKVVDGKNVLEPGDAFRYYPNGMGSGPGYEPSFGIAVDDKGGVILFKRTPHGLYECERAGVPWAKSIVLQGVSVGAGVPPQVVFAMQALRVFLGLAVDADSARDRVSRLGDADVRYHGRNGISFDQTRDDSTLVMCRADVSTKDALLALLDVCRERKVDGHALDDAGGAIQVRVKFAPM
jgi:hypothetical protein